MPSKSTDLLLNMSPETISRHELIPITEAAALIAEHVTFNINAKDAKKRIDDRIRKAEELKKEKLHGKIAVYRDEVLLWAANKWPSLAYAYGIPRISNADLKSSGVIRDFFEMTVIPGDIKRCQEYLRAAYDELEELRKHISGLEAEIKRLAPLAESRLASNAGLVEARAEKAEKKRR